MHVPGPPAVELLFIVVEVIGVEIEALTLADLFDAQELSALDRNRPTRRRIHDKLFYKLALTHD